MSADALWTVTLPYRFSRNPLYLAAVGVYLGVTLWVNAYRFYQAKVRCWL